MLLSDKIIKAYNISKKYQEMLQSEKGQNSNEEGSFVVNFKGNLHSGEAATSGSKGK